MLKENDGRCTKMIGLGRCRAGIIFSDFQWQIAGEMGWFTFMGTNPSGK